MIDLASVMTVAANRGAWRPRTNTHCCTPNCGMISWDTRAGSSAMVPESSCSRSTSKRNPAGWFDVVFCYRHEPPGL